MSKAMTALFACGLIVLSVIADQPGKQEKEGAVRELIGPHEVPDQIQIARQVDFTNEHLLYLRWSGVANDQLKAALEEGPVVVFSFTPGNAKNKEEHHRIFAVPKNAKWRLVETVKSQRTPRVTTITSAKELATAIPVSEQDPDPKNAQRIAEVEKEIAELQTRIGKLTAELATLQSGREYTDLGGSIVKLIQFNDETGGFAMDDYIIYLRADTEIMFSDKTKASVKDLKVSQSVTVRVDKRALAAKGDPLIVFAESVVISKAK